jgi:hypothetical protein
LYIALPPDELFLLVSSLESLARVDMQTPVVRRPDTTTGSSGISGFLQPAVEISLATNDFSSVVHACHTHSVHNLFVEVSAIESLAFLSCCTEKKKRSSHLVRRNEKK